MAVGLSVGSVVGVAASAPHPSAVAPFKDEKLRI